MKDSKDFQDAESVRSGNSHVTNQPMLFPQHPVLETKLRPSFVSPRRKEGLPDIWDTHGISGNVFANPHASSSAPDPQTLNSTWNKTIEEPIHMSTAEKSERPRTKPRSEMPVRTVSQKSSHLQWRRLFIELWCRPTTTADFGSPFWQVPYTSHVFLLEDEVQDRGLNLFTISYGSDAMDQIEIFFIYSWFFNAEFSSTWCENCFGTEQNHP